MNNTINKRTIFAISDIHSFYTPMKRALDDAGFDPDNPNHLLVVCGDLFDRGDETLKVLDYIESLPNKILIKGNHELLLMELLHKMYPEWHDKHNGTDKTFEHLAERYGNKDESGLYDRDTFNAYLNVKEAMNQFQDQFINYFETENYIFVHAWIPLATHRRETYLSGVELRDWRNDWRSGTQYEWSQAMWGNPFDLAVNGLNKTGKTIVFGHWHCSYGWHIDGYFDDENNWHRPPEWEDGSIWDIYKNKKQGIIGIDRCTAVTGECNVLVIPDEQLLWLPDQGYEIVK